MCGRFEQIADEAFQRTDEGQRLTDTPPLTDPMLLFVVHDLAVNIINDGSAVVGDSASRQRCVLGIAQRLAERLVLVSVV
jgi:hypothetical protein